MNLQKLYNNFSIIPLIGKAPFTKGWTSYADKKISWNKVQFHDDNIGIVCGFENLEVIDIDNHFDDADKLLSFLKDNFDLSKYPIIATGGGGYHIYYKCDDGIEGNQKLASRINKKGKSETLIETRGKGGQVVFYDNIINGNIFDVPKVLKQERLDILEICKSLNEVAKIDKNEVVKNKTKTYSEKPGDAYNNDSTTPQATINLLLSKGWTQIKDKYFRRPGKEAKTGISATFGKVGVNKFYVFSSNAAPFEPDTSYSMLGVYAELEHGGNYSLAAKSLAEKYNIKNAKKTKPEQDTEQKTTQEKLPKKWQALYNIITEWGLKFRFNLITKVLDVKRKESEHYESMKLLYGDIIQEMEVNRGIKNISKNKLSEMLQNSNICKMYNPIQDFFENLPKWDGKDSLSELCKHVVLAFDEEIEYFNEMFKKHLIRTVRCALDPKYTNRIVFVLHGAQEIGKTEIFRWLVGDELYYEENIDPSDKDSVLALARYLIINIDELDSLSKKNVSKLKAFISKGEITKRLPYGHHDEKFDRVASLVASTNKSDILTDTTNTRWLILKVKSFDWQNYTKKINPLQIWAQVLELYKKDNKSGDLLSSEKLIRDSRNSKLFLETSIEHEILIKHFTIEKDSGGLTATEIKLLIEKHLFPTKINMYQLTRELHRLHGEPVRRTINGKSGRYYMFSYYFAGAEIQAHPDSFIESVADEEDLPF